MAYEIRCRDAGAFCRGHVRADDEQEFKAKLLEHLERAHGVGHANDTLVDYLMTVAAGDRGDRGPSS
jgi:predicted small metal-binding protein